MKVGVIVPAYLVEDQIGATLAGMPSCVARVFVIDDASPDESGALARKSEDPRVRVLQHCANRGVGAAIVTGYEAALAEGMDILVVMAGDNQMCPSDLPALIAPIARGEADYVKGNRLVHPEYRKMPRHRRWGTAFLARWTTLLGGHPIGDSQCGYTALSSRAARHLPLADLWPRYGYPGDLLLLLFDQGHRVVEIPVRPVYQGARSGLKLWHLGSILAIITSRAIRLRLRRALQSPVETTLER